MAGPSSLLIGARFSLSGRRIDLLAAHWVRRAGLMSQVRVYQFSVYDGWNDELRLSSRWATREAIEGIKVGIIHEHTGMLIDQARLDENGMTERGFEPPKSDVGEGQMSSRVIELTRGIRRPLPTQNDDS
jgi:hypothetical protein